jgi:hypothetical protein
VNWLFEDPWTIIIVGGLAELLLGVAVWRTGKVAIIGAMGIVLALIGLGLFIEWKVVTDREAAEGTLYAAADAVIAGDPQGVLRFVAPEAEEVQSAVRHYLGWVEFTKITIRSPETRILEGQQRIARIRLTAHVKVRLKTGMEVARDEFPVFLEVRLRKQGDEWLVTDYERLNFVPGGQDGEH